MEIAILCKRDETEPRGERHRKEILHLLDKRPRRIRIMSLDFHDAGLCGGRRLSQELKRALVRGTTVTIIVGENPQRMEPKDIAFLQELMYRGARIYRHPRVHAKFFHIEERNDKVDIIITSANFTPTGLHDTFELGCYFSDIALKYSEIVKTFFEYILNLPSTKSLEEWKDTLES